MNYFKNYLNHIISRKENKVKLNLVFLDIFLKIINLLIGKKGWKLWRELKIKVKIWLLTS